MKGTLQSQVV